MANYNEIVSIKPYELSNESKMIVQLFSKQNTKMFEVYIDTDEELLIYIYIKMVNKKEV